MIIETIEYRCDSCGNIIDVKKNNWGYIDFKHPSRKIRNEQAMICNDCWNKIKTESFDAKRTLDK